MIEEENDLDFSMSESELETALDALDYMFQNMEVFKSPPDEALQEELQDFVDFMGFHPGTLHKCFIRYNWFFGQMEDPEWLGNMSNKTDAKLSFTTEPDEPFLVVGVVLLKETYDHPARDDTWTYWLKVMVRDKVGYSPIPIDQLDENSANHFKSLFRQIVTEN